MSLATMGKPPIPDGPTSITTSWLNQALSAGVASDFPALLPALKEVDVDVVGAGVGLMGEVLRCRLTYEDDAPSAPGSVIVKLPSSHPKNLKLSKLLQLYKREYSFYIHLAPHVPIHVAALYYGDFEEKAHVRPGPGRHARHGDRQPDRGRHRTPGQGRHSRHSQAPRADTGTRWTGPLSPACIIPAPQVPASGPVGLSALPCPHPQEFWRPLLRRHAPPCRGLRSQNR